MKILLSFFICLAATAVLSAIASPAFAHEFPEFDGKSCGSFNNDSDESKFFDCLHQNIAMRDPLYHAAFHGDAAEVKRLLDGGADPNSADGAGYTTLMSAAKDGNSEVVKILLSASANPNATDKNGYTALHDAAREGHAEVVKILLSARADVNAASNGGYTALRLAKEEGHSEVVKILQVAGAESAFASECPLCEPSRSGDLTEVKRLLDGGADPNAANQWGETALMRAANYGKSEVAELLLSAGADLNVADGTGRDLLIFAANRGHAEFVEVLLSAGADPNAADKGGRTVLMWAVGNGRSEIAEMLLSAGADPNAANNDGLTVLSFAERSGQTAVVGLIECYKSDLTDLPPEVYADRKLIEVERQLGEAEYAAALIAMDFIACYSGRHDVALPAEFYFKQAQISQLAGDGEGAKAAVIRYLKEAGREGENYVAALQMLDELEQ